jgi:hypothetical protein
MKGKTKKASFPSVKNFGADIHKICTVNRSVGLNDLNDSVLLYDEETGVIGVRNFNWTGKPGRKFY